MTTPKPALTPDQRNRMHAAILAELDRIKADALAAGADPAMIAAVVEQRLRALSRP